MKTEKVLRYLKYEVRKIEEFFWGNKVVSAFHKLFYDNQILGKTWTNTFWMGVPVLKCPFDLWIYQEIITEQWPDVIIETGTFNGGGSLFLASICDLINHGRVISIDVVKRENLPHHRRIEYINGSSTSNEAVEKVAHSIAPNDKVMAILDSAHDKKHVLNELKIFGNFVSKEYYLIVEDTNINGHPVAPHYGPGPMEAVKEFLYENNNFIIDRTKEKLYLTFNPNGYLKRI